MQSVIIILIIGSLWGIADLLRKLASKGTSTQVLSSVFNLGTLVAPLIFLSFALIQKQKINYEIKGVAIAFFGGLLAGIGGFLIFYLLSKGVDISNAIPSIRVLSIILVAVGGVVLFSEELTLQLALGVIFSIIGIYLTLFA